MKGGRVPVRGEAGVFDSSGDKRVGEFGSWGLGV